MYYTCKLTIIYIININLNVQNCMCISVIILEVMDDEDSDVEKEMDNELISITEIGTHDKRACLEPLYNYIAYYFL